MLDKVQHFADTAFGVLTMCFIIFVFIVAGVYIHFAEKRRNKQLQKKNLRESIKQEKEFSGWQSSGEWFDIETQGGLYGDFK